MIDTRRTHLQPSAATTFADIIRHLRSKKPIKADCHSADAWARSPLTETRFVTSEDRSDVGL
jgi:hypothetical protein